MLQNVIGMVNTTTGAAGNPISVITTGQVPVPNAFWDAIPAVTDVGKRVYLSDTAGNWTLTPPANTGDLVIRVGIVTVGGSGAVKVNLQFGEGTVL